MIRERELALSWLHRYIPTDAQNYIHDLPIPVCYRKADADLTAVELPEWASDLGVDGYAGLLVPSYCIGRGESSAWLRTDWLRAAFEMLTCQMERQLESENGPA